MGGWMKLEATNCYRILVFFFSFFPRERGDGVSECSRAKEVIAHASIIIVGRMDLIVVVGPCLHTTTLAKDTFTFLSSTYLY